MNLDTDTNQVTRDMTTDMTDPDTDTVMVTLAEAAELADVSVRTIRRWIQHGLLPVMEGEQGKRVSPADIPRARERAGHGQRRGHVRTGHGHVHGHKTTVTDTVTVTDMTTAQLQAIALRDTFIQPLVDQLARQEEKLTAQAEQIGRLSAERDQFRAELEQVRSLAASSAAARGPEATQDAPVGTAAGQETPRGFWTRLRALLGGHGGY